MGKESSVQRKKLERHLSSGRAFSKLVNNIEGDVLS